MGNCCGTSKDDNFHGEGRTLGAQPASAPVPNSNARAAVPPRVAGAGKTLGGSARPDGDQSAPGAAAARAAEERAKAATQNKGKLGRQLDNQRNQTIQDTLTQSAKDNVAARDAAALAETRAYQ